LKKQNEMETKILKVVALLLAMFLFGMNQYSLPMVF